MNITQLLTVLIANKIADMHICMPAKVIDYDYKTKKASVQPALNQKYNDGEVIKLPIINNVPVMHPSAGGASIIFPIKAGDTVLLVFSERSLEEWLQDGKQVTPDDPRQNDLTDAVALIGLKPFSETSPAENADDFLIDFSGSKVRLKPDGIVEAESSNINLIADEVNMTVPNVNISGKLTAANIESTGELKGVTGHITEGLTVDGAIESATAVIGAIDFATHMHSGVTPGSFNTGVVV